MNIFGSADCLRSLADRLEREPWDQAQSHVVMWQLHLRGAAERVDRERVAARRAATRAESMVRAFDHAGNQHRIYPHGHYTYALYDDEGSPLYIGVSSNVLARLGQHVHTHGSRVESVAILTKHRSRYEAECMESRLIQTLQPPLNTMKKVAK